MEETWQDKLQVIIKELLTYDPEKIILYGSAARGEFSENSDIDLLIIKKTDKDMFERIGDVLTILRNRTIPIEPIVLTPEEFQKMCAEERLYIENVLKEGKILYEKR